MGKRSFKEIWKDTFVSVTGKLNDRAEMGPQSVIGFVILVPIVLILMSTLFPTAFENIYGADVANWTINGEEDETTTALWFLIPAIICIVTVLAFLKWANVI